MALKVNQMKAVVDNICVREFRVSVFPFPSKLIKQIIRSFPTRVSQLKIWHFLSYLYRKKRLQMRF